MSFGTTAYQLSLSFHASLNLPGLHVAQPYVAQAGHGCLSALHMLLARTNSLDDAFRLKLTKYWKVHNEHMQHHY